MFEFLMQLDERVIEERAIMFMELTKMDESVIQYWEFTCGKNFAKSFGASAIGDGASV